jgi:hypothetical protein
MDQAYLEGDCGAALAAWEWPSPARRQGEAPMRHRARPARHKTTTCVCVSYTANYGVVFSSCLTQRRVAMGQYAARATRDLVIVDALAVVERLKRAMHDDTKVVHVSRSETARSQRRTTRGEMGQTLRGGSRATATPWNSKPAERRQPARTALLGSSSHRP